MRIHRVEMTGFGPYRDTESVDFDAFEDDGIFLITGRTGAGKTSILDAITYALFGTVPRYDGGAGDKVRSDYIGPTDRCVVELELSTTDARYRVTRSPSYERPKRRGSGTTTEHPTFELAVLDGDTWEVIEARLGNAETRIEQIIQLSAKQFLQVILLAQGQFQEFLVATSERRRDLLRMLFDTRRFSDYSESLDARARALAAQLTSSSTAIGANSASLARETEVAIPDTVDLDSGAGVQQWVDELVGSTSRAATAAAAALEAAHSALEIARTSYETARAVSERQARRADSLAQQARLEDERAAIEVDRARLSQARRAALARHAIDASQRATERSVSSRDAHRTAAETFARVLPGTSNDPDDLAALVQQLTERLGSLRSAAAQEADLPRLEAQVRRAADDLASFDLQVQADTRSRADRRADLSALTSSWDDLEARAAELVAADQALAQLEERHRSARDVEQTDLEIEHARALQLDAGKAVTEASIRRDQVRRAQRDGHAGVLAQSLRPDEPCLVCGSTTHPSPAVLADDHVDDAAVEQAEAAFDGAVQRSHRADQEVLLLTTRRAGELSAAGGLSVDALSAQVEIARTTQAEASRAATALAEAKARRLELEAEIGRLDEQVELGHDRRQHLAAAHSSAVTTHDRSAAALAEARGTHETVAARLAEAESQAHAARTLLEATSALHDVTAEAASAEQTLMATLSEQGLTDVAAATAASLPAAEQSALEARIGDHEARTSAVVTALASSELQGLPADPVDLAAPDAALAAATIDNRQAIADDSAARRQLATVDGLATEIGEALAASADLHERYAVVNRLASTVRGQTPNTMKMMLETFALAAELEEIVTAANSRLTSMTGGRYEFLHSDAIARGGAQSGLALDVLDAYTGETRQPQSLSGGEKFQASLALALGLAEVLTNRAGGLRLDTLFIDEGFGSLDSDTLETTMATLDNLREGGRTIGLISHVEAMKESIPAQLFVDQTDGGWSTIRTT